MKDQRRKKKATYASTWLITTLLVLAILVVSVAIFMKANDTKGTTSEKVLDHKGSYIIAEEGLDNFRTQINDYMAAQYNRTLQRYNQLSIADRAAFDVEAYVTANVQKYLNEQVGKPIIAKNYDKVDGIQPTTSTLLEQTPNNVEYSLKTTATIGSDTTQLSQIFRIDLDVPKTMVEGKYNVQYVVHASNKIVVQNAANVLGLLANKNPADTTIDGSSCQHEFTGGTYSNKCINDGNMTASPLKIINGQSFEKFLPTFPTKEIKSLEESDYNEEDLYFTKKIAGEKRKARIHYLQDGILTIDTQTLKAFKEDEPFSFTSSEERLHTLDIDGVEAYIQVGDGVQTLRIDELTMTGNAKLHILGNGNLKLFIKSIPSSEGRIIADSANVATYYDGEEALNLSNNFTSSGFIYVKKADASMMLDTYSSNIITGGNKLLINGGKSLTSQLILAPKANIEIMNRTNFKGAIIGESVIVNSSTVTFNKPDDSMEFPIDYAIYGDVKQYLIFSKATKVE